VFIEVEGHAFDTINTIALNTINIEIIHSCS